MYIYTFDAATINLEFAERLRRAEHERLVQRVLANQPTAYMRLLEKLGDLLIAVGATLKAQQPQELVEA
jgi:hypothetical protein